MQVKETPFRPRLRDGFLLWIGKHFFEFKFHYLVAILCLLFLNLLQVQIPELAKNMAEKILKPQTAENEISILYLIGLAAGIILFRTGSRWFFFFPARIQQKNLRVELLRYLQFSPPKMYQQYNSGALFEFLYSDINRLRGLIGFAFLQLTNIVIAGFVLIPKISELSPDVLKAFIPIVLSVAIFSIVMLLFRPFMTKGMEYRQDVQNNVIEGYQGKQLIQSFGKIENFVENFDFYSYRELRNFFISSLGPIFSRPLVPLGVSLSLIWGAIVVQKSQLGVENFVYFSGFLYLVLEPLMFLSWLGVVGLTARVSWNRLQGLLSSVKFSAPEVGDGLSPKVEVHGTEITPQKGKIIGICGPTGAGKSFWMTALAQKIRDDGYSVEVVAQEPYLFNDTVGGNILLGRELENSEKIDSLIELFRLEDIGVNERESIPDIEVGEYGKRISGGQAKRIALSRSLLEYCPHLFWDDPFSSVDLHNEQGIWRELKDRGTLKQQFLVLTSHRLSTIRETDELIFIDCDHQARIGLTEIMLKDPQVKEFFEQQSQQGKEG